MHGLQAADTADQKRKLISLVLGATVDAQPSPTGSPPPVPTASQPHFRAKLPQEVSAAKAESFLVMLSYRLRQIHIETTVFAKKY
eukprot:COSAG05_NODE_275_length_12406_cov_12.621841_15_plen_85_part_00